MHRIKPASSNSELVIGKFSQALPGPAQNATWKLAREPDPEQPKKDRAQLPIVVEDRPGHISQRGTAEGAPSTATYFLLVRRGDVFEVHPASAYITFKPVVVRQGYATLEEAEAAMERGPGQAQSAPSSKTAQLLQKTEEVERAREVMVGGDDDDEAGSADDEAEQRRARSAAGAAAASANPQPTLPGAKANPASKVGTAAGKKGEDWEYEDNPADDDQDMGEGDGDEGGASPSVAARPAAAPSADASPQRSSESVSDDEDGDEADLDDLDALANNLQGQAQIRSGKRTPTPPPAASKKRKPSHEPDGASARKRATLPPLPPQVQLAVDAASQRTDMPSADEILSIVRPAGRMEAKRLFDIFKRRVGTGKTPEASARRDKFRDLVKQCCKFNSNDNTLSPKASF